MNIVALPDLAATALAAVTAFAPAMLRTWSEL
jgi:hypothetical protein